MSCTCPSCSNNSTLPFFKLLSIPVSIGVQWATKKEALTCKKGDLVLMFCEECGFIWNSDFDEKNLEYSQAYDNSLDFSSVFQEFVEGLSKRLIDTYDIRGKDIVELGCGKGHFLNLICKAGGNRGVGFDPSFEGDRDPLDEGVEIEFHQDFYDERYTSIPGDLICCRHVFEHVSDPTGFLENVKKTIGDRTEGVVYFEVPNSRFILERHSIWDIIYEHCNYFTLESMNQAFTRAGFKVLRSKEVYNDQFISLEATFDQGREIGDVDLGNKAALAELVGTFSAHASALKKEWTAKLGRYAENGKRLVIWGGGAKSVGFLNMLKVFDQIDQVVDINPHKHGKFIPGTGQLIVPPEELKESKPDVILLMNPIYHEEVSQQLKDLGLSCELVPVS